MLCKFKTHSIISIHALREEGDGMDGRRKNRNRKFQSTPSARRATIGFAVVFQGKKISIHALREEGD